MIEKIKVALFESAAEMLDKRRIINKVWITNDILDFMYIRRALKKIEKIDSGVAWQYCDLNRNIRKIIKQTKENWLNKES